MSLRCQRSAGHIAGEALGISKVANCDRQRLAVLFSNKHSMGTQRGALFEGQQFV